jgi:hypothetical protein
MVWFIGVMFVISVLFCAGEAYWERDWPREGAKYLLLYAGGLTFWLLFLR